MARRRELNAVAASLYGSFISRNNDVGGYWGIGKLHLLARQHGTQTVCLDLLRNLVVPADPQFSKLVAGYHAILLRQLSAKRIPADWVTSAFIELDFKPKIPLGTRIPIVTRGAPFKLVVSIGDDMEGLHAVAGYSYCDSHDPRREYRSGGSERF